MSQLPLSPYAVPSPPEIARFKQLFETRFHKELDNEQALELATRFLQLVTIVIQNETSSTRNHSSTGPMTKL